MVFTFTEENFAKIKEIDELSEEGFQEIFELFLDVKLQEIRVAQARGQKEIQETIINLSNSPEEFRNSNPKSFIIDGTDIDSIPLPAYLKRRKSWLRIFHIVLGKLKERYGIAHLVSYLQNIGIETVYGNNARAETGQTLGGWATYPDLGFSVRLTRGEDFQPAIQKIAEKEGIAYSVEITWSERDTTSQEHKGKRGHYSYAPSSAQSTLESARNFLPA